MTEYLKLQQKKFLFYDVFRIACQEALDNFDGENNATINIQRVFRGTLSREKLSKKKLAFIYAYYCLGCSNLVVILVMLHLKFNGHFVVFWGVTNQNYI